MCKWDRIDKKSSDKCMFKDALFKSYKHSKIHEQNCSYNLIRDHWHIIMHDHIIQSERIIQIKHSYFL